MEPATPAELDGIIADLLADPGPPLMVTFADGRTMPAGTRRRTYGSYSRARERAKHATELRAQLEALMRSRGWRQNEHGIWRPDR